MVAVALPAGGTAIVDDPLPGVMTSGVPVSSVAENAAGPGRIAK